MDDKFILNGKSYNSRLIIGSGKYKDFGETKKVLEENKML